MKTYKEIGAFMKAARIKKGLTQKEFGLAIGIDSDSVDAYIRTVENGRTHPPYARLRTIAEVLDVSVYDLIP